MSSALAVGAIVLVAGVRINHRLRGKPFSSLQNRVSSVPGDVLCRPDGQRWAEGGRDIIIIAASPSCSTCTNSKDFFQELDDSAARHKLPLVYVLPEQRGRKPAAGLKTRFAPELHMQSHRVGRLIAEADQAGCQPAPQRPIHA